MAVELGWAGAAHLTVVTRREEQGKEVADLVRRATGIPTGWQAWDGAVTIPVGTDILMNATTLGAAPGLEPVPVIWDGAGDGLTAVDVITNPRLTPFLTTASERGCAIVDGVEMLVQLAMQLFESWTGVVPEEEVFQRAVSAALGE
jgi:shikimate dehydrogenase